MQGFRLIVAAAALGISAFAPSQTTQGRTPPARPNTVVGDLQEHASFESKILGNRRSIWVWTPPGYTADPKRRYPVLYMGDGQNLFNLETSYLPDQEWRVDEIATALIEARLIEPIIIVGVANAGADRANEYLPTAVRGNGGRAPLFARFLIEEVKPMIDRQYRTKTDARNTGLAGSSFGGIMALTVGLNNPKSFGKIAALSPSIWWDNRQMLKAVDAMPKRTNQRVWLDIGTAESTDALDDTVRLHGVMVAKGWVDGKDMVLYVDHGAKHNENAWAGRMDSVLLWLFGRR